MSDLIFLSSKSTYPGHEEGEKMSDCERCSNYEYDEMLGEYICEAPIDQDAWERMLEGGQKSCPYYIEDGEYKTVNKQI
ncbi:MAG TPA: hypothetical protein DCW43_06530 [Clostridiales bacterium]|nr:hypothetical protein [Clostridiales bacterium]